MAKVAAGIVTTIEDAFEQVTNLPISPVVRVYVVPVCALIEIMLAATVVILAAVRVSPAVKVGLIGIVP
jgi:hypothetical protein